MKLLAAAVPMAAITLALSACSHPGGNDENPPQPATSSPSAAAAGEAWTVKSSDFQVIYRLDGAITVSTSVGVDVPTGTTFAAAAGSGDTVKKGQRLGALTMTRPSAGDGQGTVAASQRQLVESRLGDVAAPFGGIAKLSPSAVRVDASGLDVVVPLKPLQELRYRGMRFTGDATVETVLGQRTSACVAVWIESTPAQAATDAADADQAPSSAAHCRLAADLETAAGLPAVLALTSQAQKSVIAVPLIYIGLAKDGDDYIARVHNGGGDSDRVVVVGATDGVRRVITSGLKAGDVLTPVKQQ